MGLLCSVPLLRRHHRRLLWTSLHQAAALFGTYALFRHVPAELLLPRTSLPAAAALYVLLAVLYGAATISRNGRDNRCLVTVRRATHGDALTVYVRSPHPLTTGQYATLWIPRLGFRLNLDCFTIVACTAGESDTIELLVNPAHRLGQVACSPRYRDGIEHRALLSPHGRRAPMTSADRVLIVATDAGIASHLPYLDYLSSHASRNDPIRVRRVHVIWVVTGGDPSTATGYLTGIFSRRQYHAKSLFVSIYYGDRNPGFDIDRGQRGRAEAKPGFPDLLATIEQEATPGEREASVDTLVVAGKSGTYQRSKSDDRANSRQSRRPIPRAAGLAAPSAGLPRAASRSSPFPPRTTPARTIGGFWLDWASCQFTAAVQVMDVVIR